MAAEAPDAPDWPPRPYRDNDWPTKTWLRFESQSPANGRPSRLVSHPDVPYVIEVPIDAVKDQLQIERIAFDYLVAVNEILKRSYRNGLGLPPGWLAALRPEATDPGSTLSWLPIWPTIGDIDAGKGEDAKPTLASWNLSRAPRQSLPAPIVLVAAEVYSSNPPVLSHSIGVRVPMQLEQRGERLRVIIRSVTAELPRVGELSITEIESALSDDKLNRFRQSKMRAFEYLLNGDEALEAAAQAALVDAETFLVEELRFGVRDQNDETPSITVKTVGKARRILRAGRNESHQIVSSFQFNLDDPDRVALRLIATETAPLVTHAAPGTAEVFRKTPPGWVDPADPDADYDWSMRRPTRVDPVLDAFRVPEAVGAQANVALEDTGFVVRLCPEIVHADKGQPGTVKHVTLDGTNWPDARRDDFSAISAFTNSRMFFDMLDAFGIDPNTFVVRAEVDVQIFYRSGIFPGPGGDGRTINAQVGLDKTSKGLPTIDMRLALAELSRWAKVFNPAPAENWAQPLGIATSGRWILHEYGHYLLAARIGQLEFDFAHSAGDAMAAVFFDPGSRLADTRGNVSENFRGYTYPFVFATRRHDREVLLGWAWYGTLNRSALEAAGSGGEFKGYLTEQILSTTIFTLYRSLGGDTMCGNAPDRYTRGRASHMTLFLLIKAIESFSTSPSVAEMLELAMEDADLTMALALPIPAPDVQPPLPADEWQPGRTHKVVRWAFEAQGMFPLNPDVVHNQPGQAPPVDIYILNQRPTDVETSSGSVEYGPGAYVPVSLDWGPNPQWTVSDNGPLVYGNRGLLTATGLHLRAWIGVADGDPGDPSWALENRITWKQAYGPVAVGPISSTSAEKIGAIDGALTDFEGIDTGFRLLLIEVSCPDDRANTDPLALLPSAVADGAAGLTDLPEIPRQLTDLVAGDNNLGLVIQNS